MVIFLLRLSNSHLCTCPVSIANGPSTAADGSDSSPYNLDPESSLLSCRLLLHMPSIFITRVAVSNTSLSSPPMRTHFCSFNPSTYHFAYLRVAVISGVQFSSVQSLSHVQLFATPWTAARQASLSTRL